MLGAGKRNYQIAVYNVDWNPDSNGNQIGTLDFYANKWANINQVSAREQEIGKSFSATVTHKLTTLFDSNVKNTQVIWWGTRQFSINGVTADDFQRENYLWCSEIVGNLFSVDAEIDDETGTPLLREDGSILLT